MSAKVPQRHSHFVTTGAHMSSARINYIVSSLYPNYVAKTTEAEPRVGVSPGCRVYNVELVSSFTTPSPYSVNINQPFQAVLKVCGPSLNQFRVQNEVSALFLLARYCPSVPAPKVMAWSEDGLTISTFDRCIPSSDTTGSVGAGGGAGDDKPRPWILITRPPGRLLTTADLDSPAGPSIISQIARYQATWRKSVPAPPKYGNIRFQPSVTPSHSLASHEIFKIEGFVLAYRPVSGVATTTFDFYRSLLKDQIAKVMAGRAYDDVRCDLVPLVAEFIERDLLYLACVRPDPQDPIISPVFSCENLAPRNIYVQDWTHGQVTVSGLADFEFAAFLPEPAEFVIEVIQNEGDWQDRHYRMLVTELARQGCRVPPIDGLPPDVDNKFAEQVWAESCLLCRLIVNIAPLQVIASETNHENLRMIDRAGRVVRNSIDKLKWMRPQRPAPNLRKGLVVNPQMDSQQQQQHLLHQLQSKSVTEWQLPRQHRSDSTTASASASDTAPTSRTPTPTSCTPKTTSPSATARTVMHPKEL